VAFFSCGLVHSCSYHHHPRVASRLTAVEPGASTRLGLDLDNLRCQVLLYLIGSSGTARWLSNLNPSGLGQRSGYLGSCMETEIEQDTYFGDMNTHVESAPTVNSLAFAGFDPITTLLMFPRDETGCPQGLISWLNGISSRYEGELRPDRDAFSFIDGKAEGLIENDLEQCSHVYRALRAKVPGPFYIDDVFSRPAQRFTTSCLPAACMGFHGRCSTLSSPRPIPSLSNSEATPAAAWAIRADRPPLCPLHPSCCPAQAKNMAQWA
jgi:hypothetical protein